MTSDEETVEWRQPDQGLLQVDRLSEFLDQRQDHLVDLAGDRDHVKDNTEYYFKFYTTGEWHGSYAD